MDIDIAPPSLATTHEALSVARGQRYADQWLADQIGIAQRGEDPDRDRRHLRNWQLDGKVDRQAHERGPKLAYRI